MKDISIIAYAKVDACQALRRCAPRAAWGSLAAGQPLSSSIIPSNCLGLIIGHWAASSEVKHSLELPGAHWPLGSLERAPSSPRVAEGSLATVQPRATLNTPSSCLGLIGPSAASSKVLRSLELPGAHCLLGSLEQGPSSPRVAWGSLAPGQPRARSLTPSSCLWLIGPWQPRARSIIPSSCLGLTSPWSTSSKVLYPLELLGAHWPLGNLE